MSVLIPFPAGCVIARYIQRVKRFSVLVEINGEKIWAHTNNTGSMLGLLRPGCEVFLSPAANPKRKLPYTLELAKVHGNWVGVNTLTPNRILKKAFEEKLIPEMAGYDQYTPEAKVGNSRLDAKLTAPGKTMWIEAKNVTMSEYQVAAFPDAVTTRGLKHLEELISLAAMGHEVALFFLVQRPDVTCFGPADFIDPAWAEAFYRALNAGVMAWPHVAGISQEGIGLGKRLEVVKG